MVTNQCTCWLFCLLCSAVLGWDPTRSSGPVLLLMCIRGSQKQLSAALITERSGPSIYYTQLLGHMGCYGHIPVLKDRRVSIRSCLVEGSRLCLTYSSLGFPFPSVPPAICAKKCPPASPVGSMLSVALGLREQGDWRTL